MLIYAFGCLENISFLFSLASNKYITNLDLDFCFNVLECLRFTLDFIWGHMSAI
jgi:hypothetical protein